MVREYGAIMRASFSSSRAERRDPGKYNTSGDIIPLDCHVPSELAMTRGGATRPLRGGAPRATLLTNAQDIVVLLSLTFPQASLASFDTSVPQSRAPSRFPQAWFSKFRSPIASR